MFVRVKRSGTGTPAREYLQIVESRRDRGRVRQHVIATLGRRDQLIADGTLDSLLQSLARFSERLRVVERVRAAGLEAGAARAWGPALVFGRLVCKNPLLAVERARKRADMLEATERELTTIAAATQRATRPLRGQARIALRVGKVLGRRKVGKHFTLEITDTRLRALRDEAAIAREAALDGIYVLRTSVEADRLPRDARRPSGRRASNWPPAIASSRSSG